MSYDEDVRKINERKFEAMLKQRNGQREGGSAPPGKPVELTESNFEKVVTGNPVVVVDFWAPWCGPCRVVSPVLEELAAEMAGQATFAKLNVDDNPAISQQFGIQGIPTIMVFKDGKPVDGIVGAAPKQMIASRIKPYVEGKGKGSPYQ